MPAEAVWKTALPILFHSVDQRGEALDSDFEAISGFDDANSARRAGEDDVARQQGHVGRNEADQMVAIENELARVRVLAKLTILEQLNGQIVRVDLRFHVRTNRGKG